MKRILSLVLTLTILFTLSACGKEDTASTVDKNTNSKKSTAADNDTSSFSDYVGMWSESDISFEKGGLILKISIEDKEVKFDCSSTSSGPDSQVAEFSKSVELSKIKNNSVEISYDEDGWGNSGVLELTFNDEYILADFKNVVMDEMANWGFYERTYKLVKNDKAQEIITQGSNDYYENNPIEITPTYDTSKASGILAQMGVTEQEFKNNCYMIQYAENGISTHSVEYNDQRYGIINNDEYVYAMCEYPNDYLGQSYKIIVKVGSKQFDDEVGKYYYTGILDDFNIRIYDFRDDVFSPNILSGNVICAYCIYSDLILYESGNQGFVFKMISAEKSLS